MSEDHLALEVARTLLSREGTGGSWGIAIDEVRTGYARISMRVRPDMTNGYGAVHGGMTFALADTAFAYACNSHNEVTVGQAASIIYLSPAHEGEVLVAEAEMQARAGRSGVAHVKVPVMGSQRVIAQFQGQSRTTGGPIIPTGDTGSTCA